MSVPEKIRAIWQTVVDWFNNSFLLAISLIFLAVANFIMIVFGPLIEWIQERFSAAKEYVQSVWTSIGDFFAIIRDRIRAVFDEALEAVRQKFASIAEVVRAVWAAVGAFFANIGSAIRGAFDNALEFVRQKFANVWAFVQALWSGAGGIFSNIGVAIRTAFGNSLDFVREKFHNIFGSIQDFVRGVINNIIGSINGMVGGIVGGINAVVDAYNAVGSAFPEFIPLEFVNAPEIPRLATGGVIPKNNQFAAILGDNKTQNEILAPEDTLRRIFSEVLQGAGGGSSEQTINLVVNLDGEKIYDNQVKVGNRRGSSLIKSGVVA